MGKLYDELQEKGTVSILKSRAEKVCSCAYMDTSERLEEESTLLLYKGSHDAIANAIDLSESVKETEQVENSLDGYSFDNYY